MIRVYPYDSLGQADHGWLKARYHFSFSYYRNDQRTKFGALRVINDDLIKAGGGFGMHHHENMEIITYVRSGAITHKDSNGNEGRTRAGDIQVMSAGSGIFHSEYNLESQDTTLFQIWIEPNHQNVTPRWNSHEFPTSYSTETLPLLVAGDDSAPLQIHQDAYIYAGLVKKDSIIRQPIKHQAYVLVSSGSIAMHKAELNKGDGAEITNQHSIEFRARSDSELLIIDVPAQAKLAG